MYFGVDYYPEHWPEEEWEKDATLMKDMNINIVRVAEFAWSKLEPREGNYDFSWLDKVIDILYGHGIQCIIGTPTAALPMWMTEKYSQILLVNSDGYRYSPGSRRDYCPNNQEYREFARKIVTKLVDHYKDNPAVVAWQIDNEIGISPSRCYCEPCRKLFQDWLKTKYGSLENLNKSWGTVVWSQEYQEWSEITVPKKAVALHNPGLLLDFSRFSSDSFVQFLNIQVDIIKSVAPHQLVTHNVIIHEFAEVNNYMLGEKLDFVCWDNFPVYTDTENIHGIAFSHDFCRNIKDDRNHWQMEEQTGSVYGVGGDIPERKLTSYYWQSIARGADSLLVWRWKQGRIGCEWFFSGILNCDGSETRWTKEIKTFGKEFRQLTQDLSGTQIAAQVALLYSYETAWAFDQTKFQWHHGYVDLKGVYDQRLRDYFYKPLYHANIPVDIISPTKDLSKYKLVVAPCLFVLGDEVKENLCRYVKDGGKLILTFDSGVKDENNARHEIPLPGKLRELIGIKIIDSNTRITSEDGCSIRIVSSDLPQRDFAITERAEVLIPDKAEIIAVYTNGPKRESASITRNRYGKGEVIYMGTLPTIKFIDVLYESLFKRYAIRKPPMDVPPSVEIMMRKKQRDKIYFLINHNQAEVEIDLKGKYAELLSGTYIEGKTKMNPYQTIVIRPSTRGGVPGSNFP